MILELSSTLASDCQPPAMPMGRGSTSAFDPDRDSSQPEFPTVVYSPRAATHGDSVLHDYSVSISCEFSNALTESFYLVGQFGLWSSLFAEFADKKKQAREAYQAYWSQIEALRSDAELDGFAVNEPSERDFWLFVKSVHSVCKAELVLVDNGNLRAVWDGDDGSHFGLQFLGDHTLQYVIFRRRKGSRHLSRVAGRDTFEGVKRQVRTFELEALLQI